MPRSDILSSIYSELQRTLSKSGFALRKSQHAFIRKIDNGKQMVGVALLDFHPEFEFSLNIGVRSDPVEDIFNKFSGIEPKYQGDSYTLKVRLDRFTNGIAMIKVVSPADVSSAFRILDQSIEQRVIPFFDKAVSVDSLNQIVNVETPNLDNTQPPNREMRSIIIARLANSPYFEDLLTRHRQKLQNGITPAERAQFDALADYLQSLPGK